MAGIIGDITTSVSSAHPAVSRAGEGDFSVTGGSTRTNFYIVAGLVVLGVIALAFVFRRNIRRGRR